MTIGSFIVLFCTTSSILNIYSPVMSEHCPCGFDSISQSAFCSGYSEPKLLQRIPGRQCVPDTIKRLDLQFNNITYQQGQFQRFRHLTYIDLSYNEYYILHNDSFSGLKYLRTLFLSGTELSEFQFGGTLFIEPMGLETLILRRTELNFLHASLFSNLPNLTYLDFSISDLASIENSPFTSLHSLQYLYLDSNPISSLKTVQSFSGLVKLEELDLSNTLIGTPSVGVFDNLTNLRKLVLRGLQSDFLEIDNNLFPGNTKITNLQLNFNHLILHENSFAGLSNINFLELTDSAVIKPFPKRVFRPLVKLDTLHMEGVCSQDGGYYNCEDIDKQLSQVMSLKKLYIDNIILGCLKQGFSSLTNLALLVFNKTRHPYYTDILSNATFEYLKNSSITHLVLDEIAPKEIVPCTFMIFRNLSTLELASLNLCFCGLKTDIETGLQNSRVKHLRIQLLCSRSFVSFPRMTGLASTQLEILDLSHGFVDLIDDRLFTNLPVTLRYLYLNHNFISNVKVRYLHQLENLVILNLSNQENKFSVNNIPENKSEPRTENASSNMTRYARKAMLSNNKFVQNECYKLPASLEILDISNTGLLCAIRSVLCDNDNTLKTLNIAEQYTFPFQHHNCFHEIWYLLKNLPKLEHLDMSGNKIKTIPAKAFSNLNNLRTLLLMQNALGPVISFEMQSFSLKTFNLSDNSIGYFTQTLTDKLEVIGKRSTLIVDLSKNNLLCDCDRIDFTGWMKKSKHLHHKDELICSYQPNKNVSVSNISGLYESLKYACTSKDVMIGCTILFVGLHLILGICYLIWYKRWKIRYLLAVGRKNVNPYHPIEERNIELEYDVYISYERDHDVTRDRTLHKLVSQVVYPALQRRGYKVLIREELEPGVGLYNSISLSLRRCKKVVALLTRDYCRDYWNVFEFNMAVLEGIYTKRQVLIPVAFEEIGREDLHDEVYAFLKAGSVALHTVRVTDKMLIDYLCDKIRDNREFGE